uniref:EGF-like domain-containing protein n=1 Tax=Chelonoidis abingdonii TaxID=106734 RepID=A0A8C0GDT0_CHEAB
WLHRVLSWGEDPSLNLKPLGDLFPWNLCENDGTCIEDSNSSSNFSCVCPEGYEGPLCEAEVQGKKAILNVIGKVKCSRSKNLVR